MDFINIIGTLFDNSINHIVAIANLIKDLRLNKNQQDINEDLYELISIAKNTKEKCKGYFDNISELTQYISSPEIGDWAIVRDSTVGKCYVFNCINEGIWNNTEQEYETPEIDIINYPRKTDFKTINNLSIIGEGNIQISGGEGGGSGADGKSAYELAVLLGYSGTLTEWLNSLVGSLGPKGDAFTYNDFTQELLSNLITLIENNIKNKDKVNHIFLTQVEYNALTTYEKDTLYIIVEHKSSGSSSFGDTFPLIFG